MAVKIKCPECGWVLGDTTKSVDCVVNCPKCNAVQIKMKVINHDLYNKIMRGEK